MTPHKCTTPHGGMLPSCSIVTGINSSCSVAIYACR